MVNTYKEPWKGSLRNKRLPSNWSSLRTTVLKRDNYICKLQLPGCSVKATEVDHRLEGDDHSLSNLQAVCSDCHKVKTNKHKVQVIASRRKLRYRPGDKHPGLTSSR